MSIYDPKEKETQKVADGVGPLYHRIYSVVVQSNWENALRSMQRLQRNLNHFSPQTMCKFEKRHGDELKLAPGDEFQIHITGPWNGPVRVNAVNPTGFSLATLKGHIEAGEIHFRVNRIDSEKVRFEVESMAKSHDHLIDLLYDKIPIVKFAQTEMWKKFCKNFGEELSFGIQGEPRGEISDIEVLTERRDEETGQWQKM